MSVGSVLIRQKNRNPNVESSTCRTGRGSQISIPGGSFRSCFEIHILRSGLIDSEGVRVTLRHFMRFYFPVLSTFFIYVRSLGTVPFK